MKFWEKQSEENHKEYLKRAQDKGKLVSEEQIQDFLACAAAFEGGELGNIHKKRMRGDDIPADVFLKKAKDEAADVYIYLHHYARHMGFDLDDAAAAKVATVTERLK